MVAPSHLKSLQALELAARLGSLKAAAEQLSITPAAVGQRVKALEDYLGVDLLVRGRSGLKATAPLETAMAHLSIAFRELDNAAGALDLQRVYEIHIAAPSDFVELWLEPRLGEFRAVNPNVRFCINGEGDAPLRLGAADCEIGFGPVQGAGSKIAQSDVLFHDFVLPVNSPENTRRVAKLERRDQLEGFPLLHLDFYKDDAAVPDWATWLRKHRFRRTAPERGIRFRRISLAIEAVMVDAGPTLCGLALIAPLIEDGRLTLPFPVSTGARTEHAFHARFRADAATRAQVKRFRSWLNEQAEATREWLAAHTPVEHVAGLKKRSRAGDSTTRKSRPSGR
jgi:LysR family glycine cleavage system transcriptional activator